MIFLANGIIDILSGVGIVFLFLISFLIFTIIKNKE
jgi:Na+-transporting methylmalonyl-CoA/oxaloacetate decarboxylase gamma subunit